MIRRRELISILSSAAMWPLSARAQQSDRKKLVGYLHSLSERDPLYPARISVIRDRLRELGWKEGENLRLEVRFGDGEIDRVRAQAAELVRLKPDAILTVGTRQMEALFQETRVFPIVGAQIGDPVALSMAESLGHPGKNVTGFMEFEFDIGGKWLEMLKETAPFVKRVMVLNNPESPISSIHLRTIDSVASSLQVQMTRGDFHNADEIERTLAEFAPEPNGGVIVVPDIVTNGHRDLIARLMIEHRLPAIYAFRFYVASGGLVSYGTDTNDLVRRACSYLDRILRGASPGDLPVQGPTKFELVINLKTAKAIGLTIPESFLLRADEVIE